MNNEKEIIKSYLLLNEDKINSLSFNNEIINKIYKYEKQRKNNLNILINLLFILFCFIIIYISYLNFNIFEFTYQVIISILKNYYISITLILVSIYLIFQSFFEKTINDYIELINLY